MAGFFQGCGFNSSGMMLGGGAGRELAHWIHHGRPTVDMFSYEPSRFAREVSSDKSWVDERSHEAYAKVCLSPIPLRWACSNTQVVVDNRTMLWCGPWIHLLLDATGELTRCTRSCKTKAASTTKPLAGSGLAGSATSLPR